VQRIKHICLVGNNRAPVQSFPFVLRLCRMTWEGK
jgi:hypothetical protein